MSKFSSFFLLGLTLMAAACQTPIKPAIIPPVEVQKTTMPGLEIIGGVEPVYFLPMKTPFASRIDTGAETSSVDVDSIRPFERDGEKWVRFTMMNMATNETHTFEKRIVRKTVIRRIHKDEQRYVVNMDIKIGKELINADFTLAKRDRFSYQGLIGRNILNGRFIIDPSIENTLR